MCTEPTGVLPPHHPLPHYLLFVDMLRSPGIGEPPLPFLPLFPFPSPDPEIYGGVGICCLAPKRRFHKVNRHITDVSGL